MKTLLLSALSLFLVSFAFVAVSDSDDDRKAVEAAVLDYVEGIYDVQPERIARSVSPDLKKYGFWKGEGQPYQGMAMTFDELHKLAGEWNADGSRANADSPKVVELYDVLDQTASVKLTAAWGVDYMQLAKIDGEWMILHVLWQSHPPMAAK